MESARTETVEAKVLALLPHAAVRLVLDSGLELIAHPAGAAKVNFTRLRVEDRVLVEVSPLDPSRGRIVRLL
jgi:translation initiation factor IF-1